MARPQEGVGTAGRTSWPRLVALSDGHDLALEAAAAGLALGLGGAQVFLAWWSGRRLGVTEEAVYVRPSSYGRAAIGHHDPAAGHVAAR